MSVQHRPSQPKPGAPVLLSGVSARAEMAALLAGVALWEIVARVTNLLWLPPASQVAKAIVRMTYSGEIVGNLMVSLGSLALGLSIALGVGLTVGLLMGLVKVIGEALDPYVNALMISPSLAFAPVFFALFGLARTTQIAVIVMYAMFVIIVNTATGVKLADRQLIEMATSFGASRMQIIIRVVLPAAMPLVFAGLRLAVGRGVKGMINGEMFLAFVGIGALAQRYGGQLKIAEVAGIAVVITSVALVLNWLVQNMEYRATRWAD